MTKGAVASASRPTEPVAEWTGRCCSTARRRRGGRRRCRRGRAVFRRDARFDGRQARRQLALALAAQTKLAQTRAALARSARTCATPRSRPRTARAAEARAASVRVVVGVCSRADAEATRGWPRSRRRSRSTAARRVPAPARCVVQQRFDMPRAPRPAGRLSLRRRARACRRLAAADHEALSGTRGAEYVYFSGPTRPSLARRAFSVFRALARSR